MKPMEFGLVNRADAQVFIVQWIKGTLPIGVYLSLSSCTSKSTEELAAALAPPIGK